MISDKESRWPEGTIFRIDPAHIRRKFYEQAVSIGIQTYVEVVSVSGNIITSIITSDSLKRIGLKCGMFITAEVKAPWIHLCKNSSAPNCSAENMFQGTVSRIAKNSTTAEIVILLPDGTELCAIITEKSRLHMDIRPKDTLWAFFDAFAVILHVD